MHGIAEEHCLVCYTAPSRELETEPPAPLVPIHTIDCAYAGIAQYEYVAVQVQLRKMIFLSLVL